MSRIETNPIAQPIVQEPVFEPKTQPSEPRECKPDRFEGAAEGESPKVMLDVAKCLQAPGNAGVRSRPGSFPRTSSASATHGDRSDVTQGDSVAMAAVRSHASSANGSSTPTDSVELSPSTVNGEKPTRWSPEQIETGRNELEAMLRDKYEKDLKHGAAARKRFESLPWYKKIFGVSPVDKALMNAEENALRDIERTLADYGRVANLINNDERTFLADLDQSRLSGSRYRHEQERKKDVVRSKMGNPKELYWHLWNKVAQMPEAGSGQARKLSYEPDVKRIHPRMPKVVRKLWPLEEFTKMTERL